MLLLVKVELLQTDLELHQRLQQFQSVARYRRTHSISAKQGLVKCVGESPRVNKNLRVNGSLSVYCISLSVSPAINLFE